MMIEIDHVTKTYRSGIFRRKSFQALKGVSLQVPRGSIYGLLGPNGAGKTTLIKILLGIIRKSGGNAMVLGHRAGSIQARRQIGYLPENHRIPRHLTGFSALEYYGGLSGLASSEIRRRTPELLQLVGLNGRGAEKVAGYSKGMLQRLGLAQAMLHQPQLIILDEPTDGVDPVGRKEIRQVLQKLAADGTTIFLNSHLLQEIELICESVAILTEGEVRKTGSVRELKRALSDAPVQMQLTGAEEDIVGAIGHRDGYRNQQVAENAWQCEVRIASQAELDQIVDELRARHISIWQMGRREFTLEEAFLEIVRTTGNSG
ncbi:MAG: ABC transporter ATP-binding protein [Planctomycetaceae bacterium]|nr:ABC transporter ATP-binding protein [Planctomycetaceae bacterium]